MNKSNDFYCGGTDIRNPISLRRVLSVSLGAVAIGLVVVLATVGALQLFGKSGTTGVLALIAAIVALAVALVIPVHWVPALALLIYALVPGALLPSSRLFTVVPPATLILVIWWFRKAILGQGRAVLPVGVGRLTGRWRTSANLFALAFFVWCCICILKSTSINTSTGWMLSIAAAVILPLTIRNTALEAQTLFKVWTRLGAIIGVYAILELIIHTNLIYGPIFSLAGAGSPQHWSVYRAVGTFGHPLFAGTFLAVAASLGITEWLKSGRKSALFLGLLSAGGVVATVSRGSMIATVVAVTVAFVVVGVSKGHKSFGRFVILAALGAVAVVAVSQVSAFDARSNSDEASLSAGARNTALDLTIQAAQAFHWLGSGPGTSGQTALRYGTVAIESSAYQLLISVGIPGLVLFAAFLFSALMFALGQRNYAAAAGLLAFAVAISGFNAIDEVRTIHVELGLLLIMAFANRRTTDQPLEAETAPTKARERLMDFPRVTNYRQQDGW